MIKIKDHKINFNFKKKRTSAKLQIRETWVTP